jgi:hypothetical protein
MAYRQIVSGEMKNPAGTISFNLNAANRDGLKRELADFLFGPKGSREEGVDGEGDRGYRIRPEFFPGSAPVVPFVNMCAADRVMEGFDVELRFGKTGESTLRLSGVAPAPGGTIAAVINFRTRDQLLTVAKTSASDLAAFLANLFMQEGAEAHSVGSLFNDRSQIDDTVATINKMLDEFHDERLPYAKFVPNPVPDSDVTFDMFLVRE